MRTICEYILFYHPGIWPHLTTLICNAKRRLSSYFKVPSQHPAFRKPHFISYQATYCTQQTLTQRNFYTQNLLHTEAFVHRSFYTKKLLYRKAFTHSKLLHKEAFTQRSFGTQKLLHTEVFPRRSFYTDKLLHTASFCIEKLLHRVAFTQKGCCTHQAFAQRSFYTQKLLHRTVFIHDCANNSNSKTISMPKRKNDSEALFGKNYKEKSQAPKCRKFTEKSPSRPSCSHSNTIYDVHLQKTIILCTQPHH